MPRLYLDYNAGAPLRPEARAAMIEALSATGNASSVHREGRAAHARIERARTEVAALVGADPKGVTFTSGGTEANNTVLTTHWALGSQAMPIDRLLVGATEHPSVLSGGRFGAERVEVIPVDGEGVVRLDALAEMLGRGGRALVSVMLANNETGVIQPVGRIAEIAHEAGAFVHSDTIQAAGRITIDINDLGVDVITLSAHKIGGPQGAGAIVRARDDLTFAPLLTGGGQEKRARAGTENVAAIAGFGAAAAAAFSDPEMGMEWTEMRDGIANIIKGNEREVEIFGQNAERLPQTLCLALPGIHAETLVIALDLAGVAVSSGSACSSGKVAPSHVLAAMGVEPDLAKSAIRVSLGWESRKSDLDLFSTAWQSVLKHIAPGETQVV